LTQQQSAYELVEHIRVWWFELARSLSIFKTIPFTCFLWSDFHVTRWHCSDDLGHHRDTPMRHELLAWAVAIFTITTVIGAASSIARLYSHRKPQR
jgi:hypothetical protein